MTARILGVLSLGLGLAEVTGCTSAGEAQATAAAEAAKGPPTESDCRAWMQSQVEVSERMIMTDPSMDEQSRRLAVRMVRTAPPSVAQAAVDQCLEHFTRKDLDCFADAKNDDAWGECLLPIGEKMAGAYRNPK